MLCYLPYHVVKQQYLENLQIERVQSKLIGMKCVPITNALNFGIRLHPHLEQFPILNVPLLT